MKAALPLNSLMSTCMDCLCILPGDSSSHLAHYSDVITAGPGLAGLYFT